MRGKREGEGERRGRKEGRWDGCRNVNGSEEETRSDYHSFLPLPGGKKKKNPYEIVKKKKRIKNTS